MIQLKTIQTIFLSQTIQTIILSQIRDLNTWMHNWIFYAHATNLWQCQTELLSYDPNTIFVHSKTCLILI